MLGYYLSVFTASQLVLHCLAFFFCSIIVATSASQKASQLESSTYDTSKVMIVLYDCLLWHIVFQYLCPAVVPVIPIPTLCVCVFFPSILDIKFVGRTSRGHTGGRSHRIFNPPSFCGACLDFCREKDSAIPFPRRP